MTKRLFCAILKQFTVRSQDGWSERHLHPRPSASVTPRPGSPHAHEPGRRSDRVCPVALAESARRDAGYLLEMLPRDRRGAIDQAAAGARSPALDLLGLLRVERRRRGNHRSRVCGRRPGSFRRTDGRQGDAQLTVHLTVDAQGNATTAGEHTMCGKLRKRIRAFSNSVDQVTCLYCLAKLDPLTVETRSTRELIAAARMKVNA